MGTFGEQWQNLMEHWVVKFAVSLALALLGPWRVGYTALAILMVLDLALGVFAAVRRGEFCPIVARRKAVPKLVTYWGLIIAAYQLEVMLSVRPITNDLGGYAVDVTVLYLGLTEFSSILRHVKYLSGGKVNPLQIGERIKELKDGSLADTPKSGKD